MSDNSVEERDWDAFLAVSVGQFCDPVFQGTWTTMKADERNSRIEDFKDLVKFVERMRKDFDDTLTVSHAKGTLEDVEHIRKPYEKKDSEKPASMADLLKSISKKK